MSTFFGAADQPGVIRITFLRTPPTLQASKEQSQLEYHREQALRRWQAGPAADAVARDDSQFEPRLRTLIVRSPAQVPLTETFDEGGPGTANGIPACADGYGVQVRLDAMEPHHPRGAR
jgi:hypothetical protein